MTGSARGDLIEFGPVSFPVQTSYRGAVAYRLGSITAKIIGGRAFQTPSGTLLFAHGGFGNIQNLIGSELLAEPRPLRPQVVTSAEAVVLTQLGDVASVEMSVFRQELSDAIRFNQVGTIVVAKNGGREVTIGGELVGKAFLGWLRPYAAVSLSQRRETTLTRDLAGVTSEEGLPALYPRAFGYVGADLDLLGSMLDLNVELRWSGPRGPSQANFYRNDSRVYELPAYRELDFTLATGNLEILEPELATRVSVSARNVLDSGRIEPGFGGVDIPQPVRSYTLQVSQDL
jgi:iron complex outermembrane receptor protein